MYSCIMGVIADEVFYITAWLEGGEMGTVEANKFAIATDFLDCIRSGDAQKPDFADGARVQLIMEKAYEPNSNGSVGTPV